MTSENPKSNLSTPQNGNQEENIEFEEPGILSEEPSTSEKNKVSRTAKTAKK